MSLLKTDLVVHQVEVCDVLGDDLEDNLVDVPVEVCSTVSSPAPFHWSISHHLSVDSTYLIQTLEQNFCNLDSCDLGGKFWK